MLYGDQVPSHFARMSTNPRHSSIRNIGSVCRVLIVDDDRDSAELAELVIAQAGHETQLAFSAREALDAMKAFAPNVVLMDIGLPDMSGFELLPLLRAAAAPVGCRIIALSGHPSSIAGEQSTGGEFDAWLQKPVDLGRLLEAVAGGASSRTAAGADGSP